MAAKKMARKVAKKRVVARKKVVPKKRVSARKGMGSGVKGGMEEVGLNGALEAGRLGEPSLPCGEQSLPGGEPSLPMYRAEYAGQVEMLCRLGAGDEEMAGFFGVGVEVLERWRREQGEFAEGVRRGMLLADAEVADRLFLRARGFTREGMRVMSRGGKEAPTVVACEEYYPPDVRACIFWLKNRRPDLWREKVVEDEGDGEVVEVKLADGVMERMKEAMGDAAKVGEMGGG